MHSVSFQVVLLTVTSALHAARTVQRNSSRKIALKQQSMIRHTCLVLKQKASVSAWEDSRNRGQEGKLYATCLLRRGLEL